MTPGLWAVIVLSGAALTGLLIVIVVWRQHFTSQEQYEEHTGQPGKLDKMRDERWDAIEDANALPDDDNREGV